MLSRRIFLVSVLLCILVGAGIYPLMGQGETIITITAPGWVSHVFNSELFAPFEAQYGVKVVAVEAGDAYYSPSAAEDIEAHLDGLQQYVSMADVVYVDRHIASVEGTRAGYLLNLAPLVASDPAFNTNDFYTSLWQSAQWDGGTWYLPASAYVEMLAYNMKAFDEAGLAYPNERWTFDEFAQAARRLTVYNADGSVQIPGFQLYNAGLFYYGPSRQPLYDSSSGLSVPQFDRPDLIYFYERWKSLEQDITAAGDFDYSAIPLQFGAPWRLDYLGDSEENPWGVSLLPGGVSTLSIEGFAVSAGTLNPELAYALANFMTSSPQIIEAFGGDVPARRSMLGIDPSRDVAALEQALENAVPISELRFQNYLDTALSQETEDDQPLDIQGAVQAAQINAMNALDTAAARLGSTTLYVTTPVPTPMMTADQIVLHFGLGMDMTADQSAWTQIVNDFLAANPAVGNVQFDTDFFDPKDQEKLDCFYLPYNQVPYMQLEKYLSIDPLMDADPTFDRTDFIGAALDQVRRDNRVWAYPIMLQPSILWYDADLFDRAGLPSPEQGWTVDGFNDALQSLRGVIDQDAPVFLSGTYGNTYLLMLIAAYGGLPYDYRTSPPTLNFTDPATVDAIRQVLDLAKAGYIGYQGFTGNSAITLGEPTTSPITEDVLSNYSWQIYNRTTGESPNAYRMANYPGGSQFTPMAFGVGAGYIQSNAQNPEACYNFIAELAKHPALMGGMPARISQINDPSLSLAQGEDVTALYQTFTAAFQQPNTIIFPSQYGGSDGNLGAYVEPLWLNRVFDSYVLDDGDLDSGLAEAQTFIEGYRACAGGIAVVDPNLMETEDEINAYYRQFADCAIQVDPSMKEDLSYLY